MLRSHQPLTLPPHCVVVVTQGCILWEDGEALGDNDQVGNKHLQDGALLPVTTFSIKA